MPSDELEQVEQQGHVVLSMNQVVAFNLMRARRRKGWTQDEAAEQLTNAMNKKWTNATLSAAERSWQSGRTREFNADELFAFAEVFELPVPYFLVPPMPDEVNAAGQVYVNFAKPPDLTDGSAVMEYLEASQLRHVFLHGFVFNEEISNRVERVFAKEGLVSYRPPAWVWENPAWMRTYEQVASGRSDTETGDSAMTTDLERDLPGAPEDVVEAILRYRRFMWELDMMITRFRQEQWRLERSHEPEREPLPEYEGQPPRPRGVDQSPDNAPELYRTDEQPSDRTQ